MARFLLDNKPAYQEYESGARTYRRTTRELSDLNRRDRDTSAADPPDEPRLGESFPPPRNSRPPSVDSYRPRPRIHRDPPSFEDGYDDYPYRRRNPEEARYRRESRDRDYSPYERVEIRERRVGQKKVRSLDGTRDLVVNLNLGSKGSALAGLKWNPKTKSWDHRVLQHYTKDTAKLNVLSSTSFSDRPDQTYVELKCDTEWGQQDNYFIQWRHLELPALSFDDFVQAATMFEGLSEETNLVVDHLLATVRKELEHSYVHGKYLVPGSVRCDGTDSKDKKREDVTAMFICTPYFAFEDHRKTVRNALGRATAGTHQSRSLLQYQYDSESTRERDASQALNLGTSEILHVPNVWTLIIGSEAMLTAAPTSLPSLMSPDIVRLPKPRNMDKGRMVQVRDPYKRQYFFPMASCKTFFEMRQLVHSQCLEDIGLDESGCDFMVHSDEKLQASRWIEIVNDPSATLVVVTVEEKKEHHDMLALQDGNDDERQDARADADDSSDAGPRVERDRDAPWTQDPRAWQVSVRRRTEEEPGARGRGSKTVERLERRGLVVNDPESLMVDKTKKKRAAEDVKMFSVEEEKADESLHAEPESDSESPAKAMSAAMGTSDDGNKGPTPDTSATPILNAAAATARGTNLGSKEKMAEPVELPEPPKMTLRIPPFLTWRLHKDSEAGTGFKRQTPDLNVLNQILGSLEKKLYSRDYNSAEPDMYGVDEEFWHGKSYRETNEKDLSQLKSVLRTLAQAAASKDNAAGDAEGTQAQDPGATGDGGLALFTEQNELLIRKRTEEMRGILKILVRLSEDIVSTFAPTSYDSALLRKIWGALVTLIAVCDLGEPTPPNKKDKKITWVVREVPKSTGDDVEVPVPTKSFRDCAHCSSFAVYDSPEQAISHLVSVHYVGRKSFNAKEMAAIQTTVVRTSTMARLQTTKRTLKYLSEVSSFMRTLHSKVHDMVEGLANVDEDDPAAARTFDVPITLVGAFEHFFNLLIAAARVMDLMNRNYEGWSPANAGDWDSRFSKYAKFIEFLGFRADLKLSDAMKDIVLLIRTGEASESVNYTAVGPRYVAFTFMRSLLTNNLTGDDGIVELCTKKTSKLQYQVLHRPPRRRLLADIQALQEEITIVHDIREQQNDAIWEAVENCYPETFRITNQSRKQQYNLEFKVAVAQLREKLSVEALALEKLKSRLKALETRARYRIEVLEEDNSKTIFVFTVVTAVFLPLSFVTSYLGMNTVDIRNTTTSQSTFWAIALPVTVVVVVLAIVAAYKGDSIVERFGDMQRSLRQRRSVRSELDEKRRRVDSDPPRYVKSSEGKDIV